MARLPVNKRTKVPSHSRQTRTQDAGTNATRSQSTTSNSTPNTSQTRCQTCSNDSVAPVYISPPRPQRSSSTSPVQSQSRQEPSPTVQSSQLRPSTSQTPQHVETPRIPIQRPPLRIQNCANGDKPQRDILAPIRQLYANNNDSNIAVSKLKEMFGEFVEKQNSFNEQLWQTFLKSQDENIVTRKKRRLPKPLMVRHYV